MGKNIIKRLIKKSSSKIILIVLDGVGDLSSKNAGTALFEAVTPNLDNLAGESQLGLTIPIKRGITPGSGPAHLSLFGYNPIKNDIGRGVLEALGIGLELAENDLAARANFATMNSENIIVDRRAGRISTAQNILLCKKLSENIKDIGDVQVKVYPGKEHRFVVIFRGDGLFDNLKDADPEKDGSLEKFVELTSKKSCKAHKSRKARDTANLFIRQVQKILKDDHPANTCLLRGIAKAPAIKKFDELYGLKSLAIATYPMYKGLARLVGMDVIEDISTIREEINELKKQYNNYDFFYIHIKKTDSYGEDGKLDEKIKVIEKFDRLLPEIVDLLPNVLCITSDHSTPCIMKGHSWHPNPLLIKGSYIRKNDALRFTENECLKGELGIFPAVEVMQILLAQAGRLKKFGA